MPGRFSFSAIGYKELRPGLLAFVLLGSPIFPG